MRPFITVQKSYSKPPWLDWRARALYEYPIHDFRRWIPSSRMQTTELPAAQDDI